MDIIALIGETTEYDKKQAVEANKPKNLEKAIGYILEICEKDKKVYQLSCRQRAMKLFDKNERFIEYINLYKQLI